MVKDQSAHINNVNDVITPAQPLGHTFLPLGGERFVIVSTVTTQTPHMRVQGVSSLILKQAVHSELPKGAHGVDVEGVLPLADHRLFLLDLLLVVLLVDL